MAILRPRPNETRNELHRRALAEFLLINDPNPEISQKPRESLPQDDYEVQRQLRWNLCNPRPMKQFKLL